MTSSAVMGCPSLQVSPARSFRVYSLGPVQLPLWASQGVNLSESGLYRKSDS